MKHLNEKEELVYLELGLWLTAVCLLVCFAASRGIQCSMQVRIHGSLAWWLWVFLLCYNPLRAITQQILSGSWCLSEVNAFFMILQITLWFKKKPHQICCELWFDLMPWTVFCTLRTTWRYFSLCPALNVGVKHSFFPSSISWQVTNQLHPSMHPHVLITIHLSFINIFCTVWLNHLLHLLKGFSFYSCSSFSELDKIASTTSFKAIHDTNIWHQAAGACQSFYKWTYILHESYIWRISLTLHVRL